MFNTAASNEGNEVHRSGGEYQAIGGQSEHSPRNASYDKDLSKHRAQSPQPVSQAVDGNFIHAPKKPPSQAPRPSRIRARSLSKGQTPTINPYLAPPSATTMYDYLMTPSTSMPATARLSRVPSERIPGRPASSNIEKIIAQHYPTSKLNGRIPDSIPGGFSGTNGIEEDSEDLQVIQENPSKSIPAAAPHWSRMKPIGNGSGRPIRAHSTAVIGSKLFLFGGSMEPVNNKIMYVLDMETLCWSTPKVEGNPPPAARAHTMTPIGNNLMWFGGGDGGQYYNDVYLFDTIKMAWNVIETNSILPSPRRAHSANYDPKTHSVYVFGGGDGVKALNDLWVFRLESTNDAVEDLSSPPQTNESLEQPKGSTCCWEQLQTTGPQPAPRGYHSANLVDSKLIIFGGSDGHDCFADLHILDIETMQWSMIDLSITTDVYQQPAELSYSSFPEATLVQSSTNCKYSFARLAHTCTQVGPFLFIIGGHNGLKYSSDVLILNLMNYQWESKRVYGAEMPVGRGYHSAVLYDSRLIVVGGYDGKIALGDVWSLDLAGLAYYARLQCFGIGHKAPAGRAVNRRESSIRFDGNDIEDDETIMSSIHQTRHNSLNGVQIVSAPTGSLWNINTVASQEYLSNDPTTHNSTESVEVFDPLYDQSRIVDRRVFVQSQHESRSQSPIEHASSDPGTPAYPPPRHIPLVRPQMPLGYGPSHTTPQSVNNSYNDLRHSTHSINRGSTYGLPSRTSQSPSQYSQPPAQSQYPPPQGPISASQLGRSGNLVPSQRVDPRYYGQHQQ